ncbi:MAG: ABC transporter permease subunit [Saprospiraceae bacterium]|nr:ABC transporter permease subunit [Saprospiraceae bacterium]MCB9322804.1 ABC transporter permease subunit [Lewinellaceae bacterium]
MSLFQLHGKLDQKQSILLSIAGFVILIGIWWALAESLSEKRPIVEYDTHPPSAFDTTAVKINRDSLFREDSIRFANATEFEKVYPLLPTPGKVLKSYPELVKKDKLFDNALHSIWLNLKGYFWAVLISIPMGFLIGLVPLFRGLFSKQVDAMRFLPLTALTGLFIIWFGIEDQMKVAFLAFGIIVFLLPVVVQRIDEVNDTYLKTVFTLGATNWQTIKTVYLPSVFSVLMDDIRVLTAISWTYIIIAELINRQLGVGGLIYLKARQGQIDKVFGILIVIIFIGFLQDRLFIYLDRRLFTHKYFKKSLLGTKETSSGIYIILALFTAAVLVPMFVSNIPAYLMNIMIIVLITGIITILYGEFRIWKFKES